MINAPKYVGMTSQDALDLGLNGFGAQLLAESFADDPGKFGDANVLIRAQAHNNQEVWMLLMKTMPNPGDFDWVAAANPCKTEAPEKQPQQNQED